MADKLKMDAINALQQPLFAIRSGDSWPIHYICVQTGLVRIDVVGKLQTIQFGELLAIEDGNGDRHDADGFYIEDETGNDMHTDTDQKISELIAKRRRLEDKFVTKPGDAEITAHEITEINLRIMSLQGKQAHQPQHEATKAAIENLRNAYLGEDAKRFADQVAGIEERIVWTTKDGKRWDRLEDAIEHQRSEQIIMAIYNGHGPENGVSDAVCDHAKFIGANAAEIFAILEPFFRNGE